MKRFTIAICTAAILCSCGGNDKTADEKKTDDTKLASAATTDSSAKKNESMEMPDSATMMKRWMDYMTPGKAHQMMAAWNGTWNTEITMWQAPGAPPQVSKGTTTNKMVLGGRYQQSVNSATMMGQPFEGISTLAYDNDRKKYLSTWIDNMGTGIMNGEGNWDEASKSLTVSGKMWDCTRKMDCNFREVLKDVDADHQTMEMYAPGPDGKEFKTMEIKYTRKK
jgi:hypothetical protein